MNTIVSNLRSNIELLKRDIITAYSADPDRAEETAGFIERLIDKHLKPLIIATAKATAATATTATTTTTTNTANTANTANDQPKKTSWSIYMEVYAKSLPGWKEAESKPTLAAEHYNKLTPEQKEQLVIDYYQNNQHNVEHRKVRVSGLDAFKKDWYARRRQTDPNAKGIDDRCTEEWKALSPAEKDRWKEIRRTQVCSEEC
jgi:hypothetical protein